MFGTLYDLHDMEEPIPGADGRYFFRNGLACIITVNDAGIWWGHIGLPPGHQDFGSGFISLRPVPLSHTVIPPGLVDNDAMLAKWWLAFEGGYSREKTLAALQHAADQVGEKVG